MSPNASVKAVLRADGKWYASATAITRTANSAEWHDIADSGAQPSQAAAYMVLSKRLADLLLATGVTTVTTA